MLKGKSCLYLLRVVDLVIIMLLWIGVEILDNVVTLGLKKVMVTVLQKKFLYFLSTYETHVVSVNSTEGCIRLKA